MSLHNGQGQRKYLNHTESLRFLTLTQECQRDTKFFGQLIYYTSARLSEIYNLTVESIDFSNKTVVIEALKRRQRGVYLEIPIPNCFLRELEDYITSLKDGKNL